MVQQEEKIGSGGAGWKLYLAVAAFAAVLYLPFLGLVHLFDWDEINFAEISREMLVLDNYTRVHVRFLPFWEKPPLFFWLQSASMQLFGVNEFSARFPNALCGIITLPLLLHIGTRLYDQRFGLIWSLVYGCTLLPGLYFQSGIIDPVFNLFIFVSLWFFVLFVWKNNGQAGLQLKRSRWWYLIWAGIFAGLAILTKGPAALLVLCLSFFVYWVLVRFRWYINIGQFLVFLLFAGLASGIWYLVETSINGNWFVTEFIRYNYRLFSTEDAGHGGFFGYHFVVVFLGCFPASLLLFRGLFKQEHRNEVRKDMKRWMLILMWVVLILFSIVQSKIVHYSSLTYFPLTYIGALVLYDLLRRGEGLRADMVWGIRMLGSILGLAIAAVPFAGTHMDWLRDRTTDPFARANMLADPGWTGWESLIGILLIGITWWATSKLRRGQIIRGILVLFIGCAWAFKASMTMIVPGIEAFSQRAAIEFFEQHQGEDVYLAAIGYKTYADGFYGQLRPENKPRLEDYSDKQQKADWDNWLLTGDIDKPAYLITRLGKEAVIESKPDIRKLYEKNGFLMYVRPVPGHRNDPAPGM